VAFTCCSNPFGQQKLHFVSKQKAQRIRMYIKGQEQRARKVKSANKNKTMKTNKFKRRVTPKTYICILVSNWMEWNGTATERAEGTGGQALSSSSAAPTF